MTKVDYAYRRTFSDISFQEARANLEEALSEQGFGVLTEIDVRETLKKKLDVDFREYQILGACNPDLAYEALQKEEMIGLLLPCNAVVAESKDGNIEVAVLRPEMMFENVENDQLQGVAQEADARVQDALEAI